MCSLCGVLGGKTHWSESSGPSGSLSGAGLYPTRLRERQERVRLLNRVLAAYGLTLDDWQGTAYVVRTRTGQSAIVDNLTQLWAAADRLQKRPVDPLDPSLLDRMASGAPAGAN